MWKTCIPTWKLEWFFELLKKFQCWYYENIYSVLGHARKLKFSTCVCHPSINKINFSMLSHSIYSVQRRKVFICFCDRQVLKIKTQLFFFSKNFEFRVSSYRAPVVFLTKYGTTVMSSVISWKWVGSIILPAHFHDVDGRQSDNNVGKILWNVQNSDNGLVISFFYRILIGVTRSLLLYIVLGSEGVRILLQVARSCCKSLENVHNWSDEQDLSWCQDICSTT